MPTTEIDTQTLPTKKLYSHPLTGVLCLIGLGYTVPSLSNIPPIDLWHIPTIMMQGIQILVWSAAIYAAFRKKKNKSES